MSTVHPKSNNVLDLGTTRNTRNTNEKPKIRSLNAAFNEKTSFFIALSILEEKANVSLQMISINKCVILFTSNDDLE